MFKSDEEIKNIISKRSYFKECVNLPFYIWFIILIISFIILYYLKINLLLIISLSFLIALIFLLIMPMRGDKNDNCSIEGSMVISYIIYFCCNYFHFYFSLSKK